MNKDIYRNIAAVTAIFIISLSVMLITNYFQVRGVTPLQTEVVVIPAIEPLSHPPSYNKDAG